VKHRLDQLTDRSNKIVVQDHVSAVIGYTRVAACFPGAIKVRRRNSSKGSFPNFILQRN
jgi:hypothetical protein